MSARWDDHEPFSTYSLRLTRRGQLLADLAVTVLMGLLGFVLLVMVLDSDGPSSIRGCTVTDDGYCREEAR